MSVTINAPYAVMPSAGWDAENTFYTAPGTDTIETTQSDVNQRRISVFDYLTAAERADVTARTQALDVTTNFQKAVNANYGGTLWLEPGVYKITGLTLTDSINILGSGMGYKTSGTVWQCAIHNITTNAPAITIPYAVYHTGVRLEDFTVIGNGSGTATPNGHTDDGIYFSGMANHIFNRVQVTSCGGYGIRSTGIVDKIIISYCKVNQNSLGGIRLVTTKATGGQIDNINVNHCEIDTNFSDGLRIWGSFVTVDGECTIQGNTGYGINLSTDDTTADQVMQGIGIQNNYFESNVLGNIYGLAVSVARVANVWNLLIQGNQFTNTYDVPDIKLTASDGSAAYHPWRGCKLINNMHKVSTPTNCWIDFDSQHGSSTTVIFPNFAALSSATIAIRFQHLSTSPTNAINFLGGDFRWSTGPDQKNADYIGQLSWDNANAVWMKAWAVGTGYADWKPLSQYIGAAAPVKGVFPRGTVFWNSAAASGAAPYWIQTVAGGSQSATRADTTHYTSTTWVLWSTGTTVWECTTTGDSAGSAPSIAGKVVGDTVVDGTVTWTCRSLTTATWTAAANLP